MKKVLVVHYSQSGQLHDVVRHFTQPLVDCDAVSVTFEAVAPAHDYPFPWPVGRFFDTFPEAVYLDPPAMQPASLQGDEDFDLIILAYQVWFLSPSLPITGFLKSPVAQQLFTGKPVVTLIACRNMWLQAQEEVKKMVQSLDGRLIGNVALTDEAGSIGSFLATPVWVLTGNKGPQWGGFIPRAGVAAEKIQACSRFGERIRAVLTADQALDESLLNGLSAVDINEKLIASEKVGRRSFLIWGGLLRRIGPQGSLLRRPVLVIYVLFLLTLILTFIPLSMLLKKLASPFLRQRIARQKSYYALPSGE